MDAEAALRNADAIVAAARLFRATATERMTALAAHMGVGLDAFSTFSSREQLPGAPQPQGRLPDGWTYWFHGFECRFRYPPTGQVVEVCLGFPGEFGVLDPWFFAQFVESTPELEAVWDLFDDDFHDPRRAIETLYEAGLLVAVAAPGDGTIRRIIAAPE